ncbi:MAG: putative hydroxymethylpyrimidine transporter CytX [Negativicutes bacterium]|nr:putative hydroxymethylpyrimidine transporter CytX [Negativicutes bacterium]
MTDNVHSLKFRHFLFMWFGAAISVAEILAGGLLAPLGFTNGLAAIIIGHLIGATLLMLCGLIGFRERIPAIESTRISFGSYGSRLFSVLNVLQLVGWTAVMIISAGRSANEITKMLWQFDNIIIWNLAIGGLILLWLALGREGGWKRVNMIAVFLLFGLTVVLSSTVFKDISMLTQAPVGGMSFSQGVELSVIMPLSWLPLIADYTRFAKTGHGAAWGSWLGYFIGSCWMYAIGLGIASATGSADPSGAMLAANLGLAALGIIILATVTTTFMDAYSAGVSFSTLYPGLNEKRVALIMTVIGTLIALFINIEQYESFLLAIGSVFAPLFAVLLTDYFILKNRMIRPEMLANWGALGVWAVGVALYYQFLKLELILGATIPVMVLTSLLYVVIGRYAEKWTYCKNNR